MEKNILHKFVFLIFLCICTFNAESATPVYSTCTSNTNATAQITSNINSLLSMLVSGTVQNGFLATSYGSGNDQVYGLAQCRGDVSTTDCAACIRDARANASDACPTQTGATIWYDYCFLKYDTTNFLGQVDTSGLYLYNTQNVTDPATFNKRLGALMDKIDSEAVEAGNNGLGKGESELSPFETIYALVQCTRDLSNLNCAQCLSIAISNFPVICDNRRGCRVLYGSCYVRYELYPFYFPLDSNTSSAHAPGNYKSVTASLS